MKTKVRFGMVGGHLESFIGNVHRNALSVNACAELAAGCFSSRDREKNLQTGDYCDIDNDRIYDSYKEMAEAESRRSDGIEFVSIVTPNDTHYEIAKTFLEAGINVICEKPLCFTIEEAEELKAIVEDKKLFFAVTYTYMGYVMVKVAAEMIKSGMIGTIMAVNGEYVQDWLLDAVTGDSGRYVWRLDPAKCGKANALGDIGTHIEYMVNYITGLRIKRLLATADYYGKQLETNSNLLVQFDNGVNGSFWVTQIASGNGNGLKIRVCGTEGYIEWNQHEPDNLIYSPKGEPARVITRGNPYLNGIKAASMTHLPAGHPEGFMVAFANIYKNVIEDYLKLKECPDAEPAKDYPTIDAGINGVRFVDAAVKSIQNGSCWVEM
ncbi:MAG: Gfo/Idh/MocA family oxidoreductase [Parasporobacterium sp.]|nr:Gfo/Idh/MocA family oxidoreductase [Parasporobacterium sp.]